MIGCFSSGWRLYIASSVLLALVPVCAARDWRYEETRSDSREFSWRTPTGAHDGGRLAYQSRRNHEDPARYTVKSRRERNVKEARVEFEVRRTDAKIEFHGHDRRYKF